MKIALALLIVAIAISQAACFRGIGGIGFRGGLGFGRGFGFGGLGFGRFGFGGWGWGGPWGFGRWGWGGPWGGWGWGGPWGPWGGFGGFGGIGGIGIGVPGVVPGVAPGVAPVAPAVAPASLGVIGKRDVDEVSKTHTICSFNTKKNMITCTGAKFNFECPAVTNFVGLTQTTYKVHDLFPVSEKVTVEGKEHEIFNLFSRKTGEKTLNDFTLIEKPSNKEVTFAVYRSEKVNENGFRVKDETCWKSFVRMMKESKPETIKFSMFVTVA